jgi:phosphatidylglycerophosphate synthase
MSWAEYAAGWATHHGGADPRSSSGPVRGWLRLTHATARALVFLRVAPASVTAAGVALALAVPAVAVLRGPGLFAAAGLVAASALADSADGAVAIMSHRTSRLGSYLDSVADRVGEAAWLLGLWAIGTSRLLIAGCLGLAWLYEYMRARAAAEGSTAVGVVTIAERPTRVAAAVAAFALGGLAWLIDPKLTPGVATIVLALWALLGVLGLLKLHGTIRADLSRPQ